MSNDHTSKPKKPKDKFETTTLLKLPDGNFEEEVTINEPGRTSKKRKHSTADEETVKMTVDDVKQEAKTSIDEMLQKKAHDRKIQKQQKSKQPQTVYVSKSKQSVYSNVLLEVPNKKPTSKRVIVMLFLLILVSLAAARQLFTRNSSAPPAKRPAKVQKSSLKLSAIKLHDDNRIAVNAKDLRPGETFFISFAVLNWSSITTPNLEASVRVYDHTGRMLFFKPVYASFNLPSDPKSEKIELSTRFDLGQDTPPGFYKIMIYVTESATGLTAERQARIKVVPKA